MIFRIHKKTLPYTSLHNAVFEDRDLPYECMAVLCYLLSKPADWKVRPSDLVRAKTGITKVYRILNDLIRAGYIVRHKVIEAGQIVDWRYDVYEDPRENLAGGPPTQVFSGPVDEKPHMYLSSVGERHISKDGGVITTDGRKKKSPKSPFAKGTSEFSEGGRPPGQEGGGGTTDSEPGDAPPPPTANPEDSDPSRFADAKHRGECGSESNADRTPEVASIEDLLSQELAPGPVRLPAPGTRPNWCQLIAQHAPGHAVRLAKIFPDSASPLDSAPLARKLYKRLQEGLRGKDVEVLTRFYRRARGVSEVPHTPANDLNQLLSSNVLPGSIAACRDTCQMEIDEVAFRVEDEVDAGNYATAGALNFLKAQSVNSPERLRHHMHMDGDRDSYPFLSVGLMRLASAGISCPGLKEEFEARIVEEVRYGSVIRLARMENIDTREVLGFPLETLEQISKIHWEPDHKELKTLRKLM